MTTESFGSPESRLPIRIGAACRTPRRRGALLLAVALLALPACGSTTPATTATTTVATTHLDRIGFERSGGVAAPRVPERLVITERADLDRLAALIPSTLPREPTGGPTGCADCRSYRLTLVTGATIRTYTFTEDIVPPAFRRVVAALSARL